MFEDYLEDAFEFLSVAETLAKASNDREAKRYYRASIFYASGAIEAFVNYTADSFVQAGNIPRHEICFLTDKVLVFAVPGGLKEKVQYHKIEDKIRLLMQKFVTDFDFQGLIWTSFKEFKAFRDSLVHPRQVDDETDLSEYQKKGRTGLRAIIEIMNRISEGMYGKPLRKRLLDLIPE